jgi:hypothetical protein
LHEDAVAPQEEERMKFWTKSLLALLVTVAFAGSAFAQGGGASSTGTIQGRVADAQGAVLPGVTVTATSPSALGAQTTVTSETGNYRFPALPPGVYDLSFELAGFNGLKRSGIQISLGFVANVNVELALATLQETVTVSGASPVIDTTSTRIQQNFKMEQLQSLPNGRDMWALLAVTPAVQMQRFDVGGNRAGTQTTYTAYGQTGQVRVLIEGINTTEGTGGAGFYFDYASLEEAFLGTSGQSAEMPNPGVQSQFIARSGSNNFQGEYHLDWYNNSLQGSNLPEEYTVPTAFNNSPIREHSNEIDRYYDHDINAGGPIKKDKIWYFGTYREQFNAVAQPLFKFDKTLDTKLWNAVGKTTYQANQKNKLIGYFQWGQKIQPNRTQGGVTVTEIRSPEATNRQDSGSWVYKGEWNGTVSDKLYLEARYGDFGYSFPLITNNTTDNFFFYEINSYTEGAHQVQQLDRDRKQYNFASTYFMDTSKGSHTFKMGAELLKEQSWEGYESRRGGSSNIEQRYSNATTSNSVYFGIPTATCELGSLAAHSCLTSRAALDQFGLFVTDTWAVGRITITPGVRYDHYKGWLPEQDQLAGQTGPVTVAAKTFPQTDLYSWNQIAPRIGAVYDLTGNGKTVIKANYGLYWHNPGAGTAGGANPNQSEKYEQWGWNDKAVCAGCISDDKRWQPGEQTTLISRQLEGGVQLSPDIKDPYTHEASVWLEHQVTDTLGARAGFVYKTEDDLLSTNFQTLRGPGTYNVPFTFVDAGLDGRAGTADDRTINMLAFNTALAAQYPSTTIIDNVDQFSRYKTFEASMNKRYGNRWSASLGGAYTMLHDFPNNAPQNPNQPGVQDRSNWNFKASGSYDAKYGIRISPVLRHQSGINFARTLTLPASPTTGSCAPPASCSLAGTTAYAGPANEFREPNITVVDVRVEKRFQFGSRTRLLVMFDAFNLTNSHSAETLSRATNQQFLKPTAVLAPITGRLGFRFTF